MPRKTARFSFVHVLKALAVLLVINSHFDKLYPISALGTGGSLGNGLFFAISGFCLWPMRGSVGLWLVRRAERLYLPTLIMTAIALVVGQQTLTLRNAPFVFLWPTLYWFVGGIFLFYTFYAMLRNVTETRQFAAVFLLLTCLYVPCYLLLDKSTWIVESGWIIDENGLHNLLKGSFKLIYNFAMMLAGKYLRLHMDAAKHPPRFYLMNAAGGGITLYTVKFLMHWKPTLLCLQFLNQISVIWFVVAMMLWGIAMERTGAFEWHGVFLQIARCLSAATLEFYLTQGLVISIAARFAFPVNIIFALCMTTVCAFALHAIVTIIERKLIYPRKG